MKKTLSLLLMLSLFLNLHTLSYSTEETTGIQFFEGSWQEALQKSSKENKLIFLDLSTSWCGWCRKMKQNTFSQQKVGDYFNAHFINVELDGEHGDGQRLAQKYGVTAYPTIYIVDKNENPMLTSEGYHEADDLLILVKSVLKDKK